MTYNLLQEYLDFAESIASKPGNRSSERLAASIIKKLVEQVKQLKREGSGDVQD